MQKRISGIAQDFMLKLNQGGELRKIKPDITVSEKLRGGEISIFNPEKRTTVHLPFISINLL